jgi:hypothetical protein
MNPSTKRRHVCTARTAGRDAASARPPKPRIRVLIADDHGVVREGLVSMIQRNKADMTVVGEASTGREAVELVAVAEGDRAGANDGNDFTLLDPVEEIVPENLVEFTQHTTRRFQGLSCMAYLLVRSRTAGLETLTGSLARRMATLRSGSVVILI